MGAPDVQGTPPVARDLAEPEAVAVADDVVIGDGVDRVAGLALPVHALQEPDVAVGAGAVVNDDVAPTPSPPGAAQCDDAVAGDGRGEQGSALQRAGGSASGRSAPVELLPILAHGRAQPRGHVGKGRQDP